jgi:hypothetical protein
MKIDRISTSVLPVRLTRLLIRIHQNELVRESRSMHVTAGAQLALLDDRGFVKLVVDLSNLGVALERPSLRTVVVSIRREGEARKRYATVVAVLAIEPGREGLFEVGGGKESDVAGEVLVGAGEEMPL